MNGLMNRYRESLKNTPEPVLPSKINGKKIDLSGLIKYAKSKNVSPIQLNESEKAVFIK